MTSLDIKFIKYNSDKYDPLDRSFFIRPNAKLNDNRLHQIMSQYTKIELNHKKLKYFDFIQMLPDSSYPNNKLKRFNIHSNYKFDKCILPKYIKYFYNYGSTNLMDLTNTNVEFIYTKSHIDLLPQTLKTYVFINKSSNIVNMGIFNNLPKTLESFYLISDQKYYNDISFNNLSSQLKNLYLKLSNSNTIDLNNLPQTLQSLYVNSGELKSLSFLPDGLVDLFVTGQQISSLDNLPNSLNILKVSGELESFTTLPKFIKELYLNDCIITKNAFYIKCIPQTMEILHVNRKFDTNFEELEYMDLFEPKHLIIRLNSDYIKEINWIPSNIKEIIYPEGIPFSSEITIKLTSYSSVFYYFMQQLKNTDSGPNNNRLIFSHPIKELSWIKQIIYYKNYLFNPRINILCFNFLILSVSKPIVFCSKPMHLDNISFALS